MVKSRKVKNIFQSTPSVGRATTIYNADIHLICISIHALRGEGDFSDNFNSLRICRFQSTPSVGRATKILADSRRQTAISIHALRGEGDIKNQGAVDASVKISIHALRGEGDDGVGVRK